MKVVSFNVDQRIAYPAYAASIATLLRSFEADVIFVQEAMVWSDVAALALAVGMQCSEAAWCAGGHTMFTRAPIESTWCSLMPDGTWSNGLVGVRVHGDLWLLCTHLDDLRYKRDEARRLIETTHLLSHLPPGCERAILAGDFNSPSHLDPGVVQHRRMPSHLLAEAGWVDAQASRPWTRGTWIPSKRMDRIDRLYTKNVSVTDAGGIVDRHDLHMTRWPTGRDHRLIWHTFKPFAMSAPAAAAAGTKRKEVPVTGVDPDAKEARVTGLDEEAPAADEIWMEPRVFADWTLTVKLADGTELRAHVHRAKLASQWWIDYITEHMTDKATTIVFEPGKGAWNTLAEMQLYLDTVYQHPGLPVGVEHFTLSEAVVIRLLHALDFTHCTDAFKAVAAQFKYSVQCKKVDMATCVELGARYRWDWMYAYIADSLLLAGDKKVWGCPDVVWTSPVVSASVAPLLLARCLAMQARAKLAETRVREATGAIETFRDTFNEKVSDYCDNGGECGVDHGKKDCVVNHTTTDNSCYSGDALETLNDVWDALEKTPPRPAAN